MNFNLNTPKSQDNQQKESAMDVDGNAGQQDKNKGTVGSVLLLDNHICV